MYRMWNQVYLKGQIKCITIRNENNTFVKNIIMNTFILKKGGTL